MKDKGLVIRILILVTFLFGFKFPQPRGYVNDYAGILSPEVKDLISSYALELDKKTGAQLAVVVVKSLEGLTIEDYAWQLFEKWGIGKKGEDLGVLLLVAPNERKVRIEVGYGFEGKITDGIAGDIIREMIPYFKGGDYNRGILYGAGKLLNLMAEELGVKLSGNIVVKERKKSNLLGNLIYLIFLFLFFGGRFFLFPLFFGGFGGGYWSGGGGGFGGFGGFGGGLSGGGGASGSW